MSNTIHGLLQPDTLNLRRSIDLHDGGDAILLVGPEEDQQPILVSKTAMILASPVWKAMFERQQWVESTATEIPFPDDDAEVMLIALRIAHLRFKDIPGKNNLSPDDLLHLAIVCDKYDTVGIVRPFLELRCWADGSVPLIESDSTCKPVWLFVAWTFGYVDSLELVAKKIAKSASLGSNNELLALDDCEYIADTMPPDILESIAKLRSEAVCALVKACLQTIDNFMETDNCKRRHKSVDRRCRAIALGSYMEWLIEHGMQPGKVTPTKVKTSVNTLRHLIVQLDRQRFSSAEPIRHYGCYNEVFNKLRKEADRIVSEMPSPMLDSHRRHMEEQTKKIK